MNIQDIVNRKRRGIDCTEDESAFIKRYFDTRASLNLGDGIVAEYFPLEWAEWHDEKEQGSR